MVVVGAGREEREAVVVGGAGVDAAVARTVAVVAVVSVVAWVDAEVEGVRESLVADRCMGSPCLRSCHSPCHSSRLHCHHLHRGSSHRPSCVRYCSHKPNSPGSIQGAPSEAVAEAAVVVVTLEDMADPRAEARKGVEEGAVEAAATVGRRVVYEEVALEAAEATMVAAA